MQILRVSDDCILQSLRLFLSKNLVREVLSLGGKFSLMRSIWVHWNPLSIDCNLIDF